MTEPLRVLIVEDSEEDALLIARELKHGLEAKVLAVADVVEAMTFYRPYRLAPGIDIALDEIERAKGILHGVEVTDACLRLFREKEFRFA